MHASQVSTWPGDQSRSGILKGIINKLLKLDERLSFYVLTAKEKPAIMYTEQLKKYKLK